MSINSDYDDLPEDFEERMQQAIDDGDMLEVSPGQFELTAQGEEAAEQLLKHSTEALAMTVNLMIGSILMPTEEDAQTIGQALQLCFNQLLSKDRILDGYLSIEALRDGDPQMNYMEFYIEDELYRIPTELVAEAYTVRTLGETASPDMIEQYVNAAMQDEAFLIDYLRNEISYEDLDEFLVHVPIINRKQLETIFPQAIKTSRIWVHLAERSEDE